MHAIRDAAFGRAFLAWHNRTASRLALSAVVLHELLVGADDPRLQHHIETRFAAPFRARARLLAPTTATWERAATTDRALRRDKSNRTRLERRGFFNDILIALLPSRQRPYDEQRLHSIGDFLGERCVRRLV